jgi:4-hydroxy-tetrahydrodipicolinate reductase
MVKFALEREGIQLVGAVDSDPAKVGRDVGELCGVRRLGFRVSPDLKAAVKKTRADAVLLTTVSSLKKLEAQARDAARLNLHVVSTCEELSFPWRTAPGIAARLDSVFRTHRVACVGTGVNPGFLMDYLPCVLTSVCQDVRKVTVERIQDASVRRVPFQQKIGAGLTPAQFRAKVREGSLRHVGLVESMQMIAQSLNWKLDRVTENLKPVMARKVIRSGYTPIRPGLACGVEQVGRAFHGGREVIRLHFRAAVGEPESYDAIAIDGTPSFRSVIPGGIHGDTATCAVTINSLRAIVRATPGLRTMLDLPVPGCFA